MSSRNKTYPITTLEHLYLLIRDVKQREDLICVLTDLDDTILIGNHGVEKSSGNDPRLVSLLPEAATALQDIERCGGVVGVITNRGGKDAANYLRSHDITTARIIGTYGFETYKMDHNDPYFDSSTIDERFVPFNEEITDNLSRLRKRIENQFTKISDDEATISFDIDGKGELLLQQKGVSLTDGFPFGLANIYNFNLLHLALSERSVISSMLEKTFIQGIIPESLWGMGGDIQGPMKSQRFTRGFEPKIKEGKGFAMKKMIDTIEKETGRNIGLIIYSGDSAPDAEAMKAAREIEKERNKKLQSIGIWTQGNGNQPELQEVADIIASSPIENAKMLSSIAQYLRE